MTITATPMTNQETAGPGYGDKPNHGQSPDPDAGVEPEIVVIDDVVPATPVMVSNPAAATEEQVPSHHYSSCDFILCGDTRIRGRRIRPGRNIFVSLCGDTMIDLHEAPMQPGMEFSFWVIKLCGDIKLIVPRGTNVNLRRIQLCGDRDVELDDDEEAPLNSSGASVTITTIFTCGSVIATNKPEDED